MVFGPTFAGSFENLVIHEKHDHHWDVEGHSCGVEGVSHILADQTHSRSVDVLSPTTEWWQSDGCRHQPNAHYHLGHKLSILSRRVGQRASDSEVSAETEDNAFDEVTSYDMFHVLAENRIPQNDWTQRSCTYPGICQIWLKIPQKHQTQEIPTDLNFANKRSGKDIVFTAKSLVCQTIQLTKQLGQQK